MANAQKKIHVDHAEIKTATVEIRQLTVNARKMTLSVFRQIPQESLIDDKNYKLNGPPWGVVNYHWGDMDASQLHVLWQNGKELRRDLVKKITSTSPDIIYEIDRTSTNPMISPPYGTYSSHGEDQYCFDIGDYLHVYCYNGEGGIIWNRVWLEQLTIEEQPIIEELCFNDDPYSDEYSAKFNRNLKTLNEWRKHIESILCGEASKILDERIVHADKYNAIVDSLCELPQLFIAI